MAFYIYTYQKWIMDKLSPHRAHHKSRQFEQSKRTAHKRDAETNRGANESSSKVCPGMRMSLLLNSKQLPLQNAQVLKCDIIIMVPSEVLLLSPLFPPSNHKESSNRDEPGRRHAEWTTWLLFAFCFRVGANLSPTIQYVSLSARICGSMKSHWLASIALPFL